MKDQAKKLRLEDIQVMSFVTAFEKNAKAQTPIVGGATNPPMVCGTDNSSACQSISLACPRSGCNCLDEA